MKSKTKTWIWIAVAVIAVIGLFAWGRQASVTSAGTWGDTDINCLPNGHQSAVLHIHPEIEILVDGESEPIPGNIGVTSACMAEIHTHEAGGRIHLESAVSGKEFTLEEFFAVWDRDLLREGLEVEVEVNGETISDPSSYVMEDQDQITISYISQDQTSKESI